MEAVDPHSGISILYGMHVSGNRSQKPSSPGPARLVSQQILGQSCTSPAALHQDGAVLTQLSLAAGRMGGSAAHTQRHTASGSGSGRRVSVRVCAWLGVPPVPTTSLWRRRLGRVHGKGTTLTERRDLVHPSRGRSTSDPRQQRP